MPASTATATEFDALVARAAALACPGALPRFATAEGVPGAVDGALHPAEEGLLEGVVERRGREITAGRLLAREALGRLDIPDAPLLRGPNREPLWPAGVTGSITHTHGYCAVAVAERGALAGLGIDAEPDAGLDRDLWGVVCTDAEQRWLASLPAAERGPAAKLVFSAKEAGFKAQFPLSGAYLELRDAEITFDGADLAFAVRFLVDAGGAIAAGSIFKGVAHRRDGLITTALALGAEELRLAAPPPARTL